MALDLQMGGDVGAASAAIGRHTRADQAKQRLNGMFSFLVRVVLAVFTLWGLTGCAEAIAPLTNLGMDAITWCLNECPRPASRPTCPSGVDPTVRGPSVDPAAPVEMWCRP
jgi:hypothetical protein